MSNDVKKLGLTLVGSYFGDSFGATLGSLAGSFLWPNNLDLGTSEGPRLDDLKVQTSTYGRHIPTVFGKSRVGGNIIWSSGIEESRIETTDTQSGGKGGDTQTQTTINYTYKASFAIAVCEGEIGGIAKIWADDRPVVDIEINVLAKSFIVGEDTGSGRTIYLGTETQTADSVIEGYEGAGNVPGFRGLAYIVFEDFNLGPYGNRIPNFNFEIVQNAVSSTMVTLTEVDDNGHDFSTLKPAHYGYNTGIIKIGAYASSRAFEAEVYGWDLDGGFLGIVENYGDSELYEGFESLAGWQLNHGYIGDSYIFSDTRTDPDPTGYSDVVLGMYTSKDPDDTDTFVGDLTKPIPSDLYLGGFIPCPDGVHGLIFTGSDSGNKPRAGGASSINEWWLVNYTGDNEVTLINNGAVTPKLDRYDIGYRYEFVDVAMEESLSHFWQYKGIGQGPIRLYEINASSNVFSETQTTKNYAGIPDSSIPRVYTYNGITVLVAKDTIVVATRKELITTSGVTLQSVVSSLCINAGLTSGDIDITALSGDVAGYVINRQIPTRNALKILQDAFFFDVVESDYKITFVPRGTGNSITVNEDDFIGDKLISTRGNELELPKNLHVTHLDSSSNFQENTEKASRLITDIDNFKTIDLPLSITPTEAAQIADITLRRIWIERNTYSGVLPFQYARLNPGDVITATIASTTHKSIITSVDHAIPGKVSFESAAEDTSQYDSVATSSATLYKPQSIKGKTPTNIRFLDIPVVLDSYSGNGYFVAAGGYTSDWGSSILYRSLDSGETYNVLKTITSESAMGLSTDVLSDGIYSIIDYTNTFNVIVNSGELESISEDAVLNGGNLCLLGDELLQFVTATLEVDGTYTLSGLLRGRKGTEWAMPTHIIYDQFTTISEGATINIDQDLADIGLERHFKGVTAGSNLTVTSVNSFTNTGVRLKPLSPVHILGARNASDDITLSWIRRARTFASWSPNTDVPLDEDSLQYQLDIIVASAVATTIVVSTESASYPAANQTGDGITPGDPVEFQIFQISAQVGRGFAASATV